MKKYLIVDTFNGEGYSQSSAEIKEFKSIDEVKVYSFNKTINVLGGAETIATAYSPYDLIINVSDDRITYSDLEDEGVIQFTELLEDTLAISIKPLINEFTQLDEESELKLIELLLESDESKNGEELEGTCHHLDNSVEIYFKIENL
jgi:hypothetical protein